MNKICALLLLLPITAHAGVVSNQKPEDAEVLISSCVAQGATSITRFCSGNVCRVSWDEPEKGTVAYTDPQTQRASLKNELAAIQAKVAANTATNADMSRGWTITIALSSDEGSKAVSAAAAPVAAEAEVAP